MFALIAGQEELHMEESSMPEIKEAEYQALLQLGLLSVKFISMIYFVVIKHT